MYMYNFHSFYYHTKMAVALQYACLKMEVMLKEPQMCLIRRKYAIFGQIKKLACGMPQ